MTAQQLRIFGLILAGFLAAVLGLLFPAFGWIDAAAWPWAVAGAIALVALAWPRALGPLHRGWTAIGHVLGWINTRVLLALVFFAVIWPIGALWRALGRSTVPKAGDASLQTYRITRPAAPPADHFDRPY